MIKEGTLDNVQGILVIHISPEMTVGTIGSRPGPMLAGAGRFLGHNSCWKNDALSRHG